MIRRPPRSTQSRSSAASDVYKRQDRPSALLGSGTSMRHSCGEASPITSIVCNSTTNKCTICAARREWMDDLDGTLIRLFEQQPRIGVLEASRRLGVARGTVQARLDKLSRTGVIAGWGPRLDPEALGYPVMAFLTLEIRQDPTDHGGHDAIASHLADI